MNANVIDVIETAKSLVDQLQPSKDPTDIYDQLCTQEKKAIKAIKNLRNIKKQFRNHFSAPKEKIPTEYQITKMIYRNITKNFIETLRSMNVSIVPKHCINPIEINHRGISGDGTRQITRNLYFLDNSSTEPNTVDDIKDLPEDVILFAEKAIGYTTVTLTFDVNDETYTIVGKTICSANDNYNGNIGVIQALQDAFNQIETMNIETPLRNLASLIANFQDMITFSLIAAKSND